jgi:hypothetical protein
MRPSKHFVFLGREGGLEAVLIIVIRRDSALSKIKPRCQYIFNFYNKLSQFTSFYINSGFRSILLAAAGRNPPSLAKRGRGDFTERVDSISRPLLSFGVVCGVNGAGGEALRAVCFSTA